MNNKRHQHNNKVFLSTFEDLTLTFADALKMHCTILQFFYTIQTWYIIRYPDWLFLHPHSSLPQELICKHVVLISSIKNKVHYLPHDANKHFMKSTKVQTSSAKHAHAWYAK